MRLAIVIPLLLCSTFAWSAPGKKAPKRPAKAPTQSPTTTLPADPCGAMTTEIQKRFGQCLNIVSDFSRQECYGDINRQLGTQRMKDCANSYKSEVVLAGIEEFKRHTAKDNRRDTTVLRLLGLDIDCDSIGLILRGMYQHCLSDVPEIEERMSCFTVARQKGVACRHKMCELEDEWIRNFAAHYPGATNPFTSTRKCTESFYQQQLPAKPTTTATVIEKE